MTNFDKPNKVDTAKEMADKILAERIKKVVNENGDEEASKLLRKVEILQEVLPEGVEVSDFLRLIISAYDPLNPNGKRDFQRMMIIQGEISEKKIQELLEESFPTTEEEKAKNLSWSNCELADFLGGLTGILNAGFYNPYTDEDAWQAENWDLPEEVNKENNVEVYNGPKLTLDTALEEMFKFMGWIPLEIKLCFKNKIIITTSWGWGENKRTESRIIKTIGDLYSITYSEFRRLQIGMGPKKVKELRQIVKDGMKNGILPEAECKFLKEINN